MSQPSGLGGKGRGYSRLLSISQTGAKDWELPLALGMNDSLPCVEHRITPCLFLALLWGSQPYRLSAQGLRDATGLGGQQNSSSKGSKSGTSVPCQVPGQSAPPWLGSAFDQSCSLGLQRGHCRCELGLLRPTWWWLQAPPPHHFCVSQTPSD